MRIGDMTVEVISGGQLWLDGGTMFGVTPKTLWAALRPPDDLNRILLETNCLLLRIDGKRVLVDTGYGSRCGERQRQHQRLQAGHPLLENLARRGVRPEEIDYVVLTHLHFDHAGGVATFTKAGEVIPAFPRAVHVVQKTEWDDATAGLPELAGAYFPEHLRFLADAGLLRLVDGDATILPDLSVRLTGGHSRGHQAILLSAGGKHILCPADLCPFTTHMRRIWTMSYDQFPLTTRKMKYAILSEAATNRWIVHFNHDPFVTGARIRVDPKETFAIAEKIDL